MMINALEINLPYYIEIKYCILCLLKLHIRLRIVKRVRANLGVLSTVDDHTLTATQRGTQPSISAQSMRDIFAHTHYHQVFKVTHKSINIRIQRKCNMRILLRIISCNELHHRMLVLFGCINEMLSKGRIFQQIANGVIIVGRDLYIVELGCSSTAQFTAFAAHLTTLALWS
jgi:hypothetical protein